MVEILSFCNSRHVFRPKLTALAMLLALFLGSIAGLILIIFKLKKMKDAIPFGPFIALGSAIAMFVGDNIISWYLGLFF